ncbi:unnamed protein product [Rotaria sordida]|uniref:Uncharacterized protein n=1 Tax=Rotaria sordida TaxID=392033 RepID=A0A815CMW8_9BILA|nr:unnamed protein product [Rotaria sordida]
MLAAVYIDTIFTLTCATIYTWLYFVITVLHQGYCPNSYYPTESDYQATNSSFDIIKYLSYYGTGSNLIAIQLCIDIPRYLCLAYVSIRLPMMVINKIRQYRCNKERYELKHTQEEQAFFIAVQPYSVETLYVRNLFRSANIRSPSRSFIARLVPKSIYEWRDDFRFSSPFFISYFFGKLIENNEKLFQQILTESIPVSLLSIFKVYLNLFVAKYIFLQQRNQILAINNHRVSMILLYFNFFLDAFLGLAASFTRITNSFLTTIIYMARLDYSPLGRQLDYGDAGFLAYLGFIQMEAIHRNPIMLAFVSILLVHQRTKQSNRSSKTRQKWRLALLLIHNPSLIIMRKAILARKEENLAFLQTMKTSEFEHLTNVNFENALKAILRREYVVHKHISLNNSDTIVSKL